MEYKIIENQDKKTISVLIKDVTFFNAKYLVELYNNERYFGNGVINATGKELKEFLEDVVKGCNHVNDTVKLSVFNFIENKNNLYPLFKAHKDKDDRTTPDTFDIMLSVFTRGERKAFFYQDLTKEHPVFNNEYIKEYFWNIELEIKPYINKNEEHSFYYVVHRIVKGEKREGIMSANNDLWSGFNFNVDDSKDITQISQEEVEKEEQITNAFDEDELPWA